MEEDRSYVSMEAAQCPACLKTHHTGNVLLDRRMEDSMKRETLTHYALCEECSPPDGFCLVVGVIDDGDMERETLKPEDARLSGKNIYLREEMVRALGVELGDAPWAYAPEIMVDHIIQRYRDDTGTDPQALGDYQDDGEEADGEE